jgi:hemolysin activation/secretion protein
MKKKYRYIIIIPLILISLIAFDKILIKIQAKKQIALNKNLNKDLLFEKIDYRDKPKIENFILEKTKNLENSPYVFNEKEQIKDNVFSKKDTPFDHELKNKQQKEAPSNKNKIYDKPINFKKDIFQNYNPIKLITYNILNISCHLKPFFVYKILYDKKIEIENYINEKNLSIVKNIKKRNKFKTATRKISEIIITNNKYTDSDLLKKRIQVKPGDDFNEKKLQEHLNFINLNPFRNVEMIIYPQNETNYDIELLCHDRFFFRPYIGTDNTGVEILDRQRIYAGFNWNKAFALDSILSYQYISSYDFKKFQAHTGQWVIFLPWENIFTIFGTYAKLDVDHEIPTTEKNHGFDIQTSLRYNLCLPILDDLTHDLILGFDFKRTDTNLFFSSKFSALDDKPVNLTQFLLSYGLNWNKNIYNAKILLETYFSLGKWLPDQENSRYNDLRRLSKNQYIYAKSYFSNLIKMPKDFLFFLMITAQLSSANLLPSETLGLGGYNTVRGYYEREINTDSGIILNLEFRSFSLSLIPNKKINDSLRFIVFLDYGYGSLHQKLLFEEKDYSLLGYGPGIRYVINPHLEARLDLGIKGIHKTEYSSKNALLHFSFSLNY